MRLRIAAVYPILWMLIILKQVSGSGVFQLRLKSFRNTQGLLANGNCCGQLRDGRCASSSPCTTFFRICLTHFMADITPNPKCSFATRYTPVLGNNSIDFSKNIHNFTNPMLLPFEFSWPGTFSLIIEAWNDKTRHGPSSGSSHELIMRRAVQGSLSVGVEWVDFNYTSNQTELEYSYRAVCNEHYYGSQCTTICRPRDDQFGHYTCNNNGSMKCLPGWKGHYCQEPVCLPGCHTTQGYCDNPNECKCRLGWKGQYCDECIPHPSCREGTCNKSWECNCIEGWGGLLCNQDLNYCTHHNPCKNAGTCTNTGQGSYTCSCPDGFNGTNCEIEVDNCQHQPCLNHGTCEDTGTGFQCRCAKGYSGKRCGIQAISCDGNPCRNNGKCSNVHGSYLCECQPGFSGANCELEINECLSSPCKNDGRCVDEVNGFRCVCTPGFNGQTCEENVNDCSKNPCLNGGTCTDKVNDFVCRCVPGYVGTLCEVAVNDCEIRPCANGGTCQDRINDFACICALGFTGKDCTTNIDDCAPDPCKYGKCKDLVAGYLCVCDPGYTGHNCDRKEGFTTPRQNKTTTTTSPMAVPNHSNGLKKEKKSLSVVHLGLIICLGAGIPLILIIIAVIVILFRHRQHYFRENMQKEGEQNKINSKCIETDIFTTIPSASASDKITKDELECSNRFNPGQIYDKSAKILKTHKNKIKKKIIKLQ
uniref:Delta-like protein n=1 Tax=Euprymna scolopes TaxID=6613 RepID=A2SVS3_EUPSC|nr:Dl [Euprymna scolopes]